MGVRAKNPEIICAMVGTAGHVDHGKTALVKMLTGCDTDRLKEEKERGMSIELGYAPAYLSSDRVVGIVDVPGHKDFIRNMVAGAASVDVLILVVAADDGIMPQTDEHLRILKLMRMPRVMVALTKIDLVDDTRRELARSDVTAFMAKMGFPDAPVIPMSNKTGDGVGEVHDTLERLVSAVVKTGRATKDRRAFRMNIERVFSVQGYGTVVTGIPISGAVALGDELEILPSGRQTRVRSMEMFKHPATVAHAGACVALNLRDVEPGAVSRGMSVSAPGTYQAATCLVATLENAGQTTVIGNRLDAMLHAGTSITTASLALIGKTELLPGEEGFVHAKIEEPTVLTAGDRFIIRRLSPTETIGGGTVLSIDAQRIRRKSPLLPQALDHSREAIRSGDFFGAALYASRVAVIEHRELVRLTRSRTADAERLVQEQEALGRLTNLGGGGWLNRAWLPILVESVKKTLDRYHATKQSTLGMDLAHLCKLLEISTGNSRKLAEELCRGDEEIVQRNNILALRSHRPVLTERQAILKQAIADRVIAAGINPPARGNVATELGAEESNMNLVVRLLRSEGVITSIGTNLISSAVVASCRDKLIDLCRKSGELEVNAFREATGAGRRVAVALLELFDKEGLTRRSDRGRVLVERRPNVV